MSFLDSRQQVARQGIGKPVRRREDSRFLTGNGNYADDVSLPGQAYAYVVRSPHAHAVIADIGIGPATDVLGVLAVLTGRDAAADGLQPTPHRPVPTTRTSSRRHLSGSGRLFALRAKIEYNDPKAILRCAARRYRRRLGGRHARRELRPRQRRSCLPLGTFQPSRHGSA
jgi:CO/xanthine dehydrogenase Mo-binding subunit